MVREFSIVQSTVVDHYGLYRNVQKLGVVAEIFFSKKHWKVFYTSDGN